MSEERAEYDYQLQMSVMIHKSPDWYQLNVHRNVIDRARKLFAGAKSAELMTTADDSGAVVVVFNHERPDGSVEQLPLRISKPMQEGDTFGEPRPALLKIGVGDDIEAELPIVRPNEPS
jgi:hypothetical protein